MHVNFLLTWNKQIFKSGGMYQNSVRLPWIQVAQFHFYISQDSFHSIGLRLYGKYAGSFFVALA